MNSTVRIAVVDDHPLYRGGVMQVLSASGFEIVGDGGCADDAVRLANEVSPDIVLIDVGMPGSGIEAARAIRRTAPGVKVVALTASEDPEHVSAILESGAHGYVLKGVSGSELVRAIDNVRLGDTYVSPRLAAGLFGSLRKAREQKQAAPDTGSLTRREEQILSEIAIGRTNKEIARNCSLSEKTVKHYVTSILTKLQVRNRVEAALTYERLHNAA